MIGRCRGRSTWLVAVAIIALAVFLCLLAAALGPRLWAAVVVEEEDTGSRVELSVGQIVAVDLYEIPSTGYRWEVTVLDGRILEQVNRLDLRFGRRPFGSAPGGDGDLRAYFFKATSPGETNLELANRRPSDPAGAASRTFTLQISVRGEQ